MLQEPDVHCEIDDCHQGIIPYGDIVAIFLNSIIIVVI